MEVGGGGRGRSRPERDQVGPQLAGGRAALLGHVEQIGGQRRRLAVEAREAHRVLEQRARQLLLLALALMMKKMKMVMVVMIEEEEGELMNSGRKSLDVVVGRRTTGVASALRAAICSRMSSSNRSMMACCSFLNASSPPYSTSLASTGSMTRHDTTRQRRAHTPAPRVDHQPRKW